MPKKAKKNQEMAKVLEEARRLVYGDQTFGTKDYRYTSFRSFSKHYASRRPRDVSWIEVCAHAKTGSPYPLYAAALMVVLLDLGLYSRELAQPLRLYRGVLARGVRDGGKLGRLMCGPAVECLRDEGSVRFILEAFGERSPLAYVDALASDCREMFSVLQATYERIYSGRPPLESPPQEFRPFFRHYIGRAPEDVTWGGVSSMGVERKWAEVYDLALIVELLDRDLYAGDHADDLRRLRDGIASEIATRPKSGRLRITCCGEAIEDTVHLPRGKAPDDAQWRMTFARIDRGSGFLRRLIADFLQHGGSYSVRQTAERLSLLLRSFGNAADRIESLSDFTSALFWEQARFIREECGADTQDATKGGAFLRGFYLFLVDSNPDHEFFSDSPGMSDGLLRNKALTGYIADGTYVTSYAPGLDLGDRRKVALILRGYESSSSQLKADDYVLLDVSRVESELYRREILAFFCSSPKRAASAKGPRVSVLTAAISRLVEMKARPGHPNPGHGRVTREEALILREAIERRDVERATKAAAINAVSMFLQWERDARGRIEVEEFALDHLLDCPRGRRRYAEPIPDDDLAAIASHLAKKSEGSSLDKVVFAVFCIALETEFRPSHICHLTVDCVRASVKPGEFVIRSATKTSGGEKESRVITESTRRLLAAVIDATDDIRAECVTGETGRYIFLLRNRWGPPVVMRPTRFSAELKKCCEELGLQRRYTAANLRDTHMTKAVEYAIRRGRPDIEAGILSGHRQLATTTRHYVAIELEKMLESTYGVIIGDRLEVDARGKVVNKVPDEASSSDRVVEGGCGCCTAASCALTAPLTCLACKSFVTTPAHEPFFIHLIEAIDARILAAPTRHDADDLVTMKTLAVMFLQAIYEKEAAV